MLHFLTLTLIASFISSTSLAGTVLKATKGVQIWKTSGWVKLSSKTTVDWGDKLRGQSESAFTLLKIDGMFMSFKGNFEATLNKSKKSSFIQLKRGHARVKTNGKVVKGFAIKTKTAVAGVRGTDFIVWYEETGETETVCFESAIDFSNKKSKAIINAGFWGGVGGKHGDTIKPPVKLSEKDLSKISSSYPIN